MLAIFGTRPHVVGKDANYFMDVLRQIIHTRHGWGLYASLVPAAVQMISEKDFSSEAYGRWYNANVVDFAREMARNQAGSTGPAMSERND